MLDTDTEFASSAEFEREDAAAVASLRLDREWRIRSMPCGGYHAATPAARRVCGGCAALLDALNDTPPEGLPL
jgi:hypothetical protein